MWLIGEALAVPSTTFQKKSSYILTPDNWCNVTGG